MSAVLRVKNWREFQHYNKRRPPWIKLQKSLLDDFEFACLPDASAALAPRIWLLASESDEGEIPADPDWIAFRVHKPRAWVLSALKPLIDAGFVEDASGVLAACYQDATPEAEAEAEIEEHTASPSEAESVNGKPTLGQVFTPANTPPKPAKPDTRFEDFWDAYPRIRRRKKKQALEIWRRKRLDSKAETIIADVGKRQEQDAKWVRGYSPEPTAYLNGELWNDEYEPLEQKTTRKEALQPDSLGRLPWLADGSRNPEYRGGNYWT